jgi:hypothetical protein
MPRKIFKKISPPKEKIENLPFFYKIKDEYKKNIFSLRKFAVAKAFFFGLFFAFIPMPFQMVVVLFTSILFKHNLPISILLVWITNPFTMPFIFGLEYYLGAILLNHELLIFSMNLLENSIDNIFIDLYFGAIIISSIFSSIGYFIVINYWKWKLKRKKKI